MLLQVAIAVVIVGANQCQAACSSPPCLTCVGPSAVRGPTTGGNLVYPGYTNMNMCRDTIDGDACNSGFGCGRCRVDGTRTLNNQNNPTIGIFCCSGMIESGAFLGIGHDGCPAVPVTGSGDPTPSPTPPPPPAACVAWTRIEQSYTIADDDDNCGYWVRGFEVTCPSNNCCGTRPSEQDIGYANHECDGVHIINGVRVSSCLRGQYSVGGGCVNCPADTFADSNGVRTACQSCPTGQSSSGGSRSSAACSGGPPPPARAASTRG